jgi:hypothetical protein
VRCPCQKRSTETVGLSSQGKGSKGRMEISHIVSSEELTHGKVVHSLVHETSKTRSNIAQVPLLSNLSGGACETSENGDVTVHQASIRICFNEYTFVYVIRGSDVPYSSRVSSCQPGVSPGITCRGEGVKGRRRHSFVLSCFVCGYINGCNTTKKTHHLSDLPHPHTSWPQSPLDLLTDIAPPP